MAHEVFTNMIWTPLRSVVIPLLQKGWQAQPDGVVINPSPNSPPPEGWQTQPDGVVIKPNNKAENLSRIKTHHPALTGTPPREGNKT